MNNNDFYGNLDRIRKLYLKQNYDEAIKIADKMDFKRLKDWKYIAMLINLYEAVGRLEDVKYFCILAYNRNLGGKKLVFKLTKVMIRLEEIDEAEELYDEYMEMAGRDNKKYELQYELKSVQGAKKVELIKILEEYMKRDLDEKYSYVLAEMYAKTKQNEKCVKLCDRIIERFDGGSAADKAQKLKNLVLGAKEVPESNVQVVNKQTAPINMTQNIPVQDMYTTQNIPVQDMYTTQNIPVQDMYTTQNIPVQDMYATQDIPMQDMYATQDIPMQDMYATQDIPMQDMYATQDIPMQDMYATQDIPMQNMYVTQDMPVQDMSVTQDIPMQDMSVTQNIPTEPDVQMQPEVVAEEIAAPLVQDTQPEEVVAPMVEEQSVVAQEEPVSQVVEEPTAEISTEEVVANEVSTVGTQMEFNFEENVPKIEMPQVPASIAEDLAIAEQENPFAVGKSDDVESEIAPDLSATMAEMPTIGGNTVRVDTVAVNAAIQEAAATMDVPNEPHVESAPDIESTMAMVEAALANETQAAQFEARMDMPEYTEEYAAPLKEKVTLRPFQPEIDKIYEIPMEVKRYFTKYSSVLGLEAKIGEYFESTKFEDKMGTSAIGNIIISGNRSSDKTTLAINIVKALNTLYPEKSRKIARTTGDNINQRGIERSIGKLLGSALIVEEAGVMDRQRILELVEVMESDTQELLIILEDSESEINELLKNNPELIEKFNHRITFKQFTVNELVEMCKRYADKCHYAIDEKALLQLYLRIDDIHSSGDGVSLEDVRDVVDTAIESAQRRANKKLFGGAKKKRVGDKDYIVLIESDFKE